jgi:Kef-type K+ transport system membrane component KefB
VTTEANILITLGVLLLVGLAADLLGRRTPLPRVTVLLLAGVALGPAGVDLLPPEREPMFQLVADMALVMIGFLLGEKVCTGLLRENARRILAYSLAVAIGTALIVGFGLWLAGVPLVLALLFAGIAPATDPAATIDVVNESASDGPATRTLLGVVAVDDVWGLVLFSGLFAAAGVLAGNGDSGALMHGVRELFGALALGLLLGLPMALLTGRVRPGEPSMAEALGMVFLCGGLALWMEVSFLLASMTMGAVVAGIAKHHEYPFHAIEGIEWPFMVLFFVLAGATLDLSTLPTIGALGAGYVLLRVIGRVAGGWLGGWLAGDSAANRHWLGIALMPQAGVALGMALVAVQHLPQYADTLLPVVIAATVLFELVGPPLTRLALRRIGEIA